VFDRSQVVRLGDAEVRVPCAEDHLRILSLHMLRHGAWRPLWLCDVAMALESRPSDFDWDLCLGSNRQRADWIACCIGLAHKLLGANVDDNTVAERARHLPGWLVSNVLKQWETPFSTAQAPMNHDAPMVNYIRHPRGLLADLLRRWPNPIEATVYVGGPFNELPRFLSNRRMHRPHRQFYDGPPQSTYKRAMSVAWTKRVPPTGLNKFKRVPPEAEPRLVLFGAIRMNVRCLSRPLAGCG